MRKTLVKGALSLVLAMSLAAGLGCSKGREEQRASTPGGKRIAVQIHGTRGCASVKKAVDLIETTAIELGYAIDLEIVIVENAAQAEEMRFYGSPTVLVAGVDVEPEVKDPGMYGVT